jgi:hypothetical protein
VTRKNEFTEDEDEEGSCTANSKAAYNFLQPLCLSLSLSLSISLVTRARGKTSRARVADDCSASVRKTIEHVERLKISLLGRGSPLGIPARDIARAAITGNRERAEGAHVKCSRAYHK